MAKPAEPTIKPGKPVPQEWIDLALSWKVPTQAINPGPIGAILEDSLLALRKESRKPKK